MDFRTLELPKDKIAYPSLYAPPVSQMPDVDTPESADAVLARQRYEGMLKEASEGREAVKEDQKANEALRLARLEAERIGIPYEDVLGAGANRGRVVEGITEVNPRGLNGPASEGFPISDAIDFKKLEQAALPAPEGDTMEWAKAQGDVQETVSNIKSSVKEISPKAFKTVEGKKFISKSFITENKDKLEDLATSFGLTSAKDVLEALITYKGVQEDVGTTKYGKREYAGKKMTDLPTAKVEGKTLILPNEWKQEHLDKAKEVAKKYGLKPEEFFAFVDHETGGTFSPKVTNVIGATGLVQFTGESAFDTLQLQKRSQEMEAIRASEGKITPKQQLEINKKYPFRRELKTREEKQKAWTDSQFLVANMPLDEQLDLVDAYLEGATRGKKGLESVYAAVFAGDPNKSSMPMSKGNEGLDKNGDGIISREEFTSPVRDKLRYRDVKVGSNEGST